MAHLISPVPENAFATNTVRVPDTIDNPITRAPDVELIAQTLLNKIYSLRDLAGILNEGRTWTATQLSAIPTPSSPSRHLTLNQSSPTFAANAYRMIDAFATSDSTKLVRVYSGTATGSAAAWLITVNARFSTTSAQNWTKDLSSRESSLLALYDGELKFYSQAPGTASWTTWDRERGHVSIGGTLTSSAIKAAVGEITSLTSETGKIDAITSDSVTSKAFTTSGNYKLSPAKRMWIDIPLVSSGEGNVLSSSNSINMGHGDTAWFPVPQLPAGTKLHRVQILVSKVGSTGTVTFYGHRRTGAVWSSPAAVPTNAVVAQTAITNAGIQVISVSFDDIEILSNDSYSVRLFSDANSTVNLYQLRADVSLSSLV
jgi:hypothetical protein